MKICKLHSTNWYILVWNTLLIGRSCSIMHMFYNNENCLVNIFEIFEKLINNFVDAYCERGLLYTEQKAEELKSRE